MNSGTVTFQDPGMHPKTISFADDSELKLLLDTEALAMNYTRAHVEREGARLLRWSTAEGVTFVRSLGHHEWKDWAKMSTTERQQWREQDHG